MGRPCSDRRNGRGECCEASRHAAKAPERTRSSCPALKGTGRSRVINPQKEGYSGDQRHAERRCAASAGELACCQCLGSSEARCFGNGIPNKLVIALEPCILLRISGHYRCRAAAVHCQRRFSGLRGSKRKPIICCMPPESLPDWTLRPLPCRNLACPERRLEDSPRLHQPLQAGPANPCLDARKGLPHLQPPNTVALSGVRIAPRGPDV